MNPIPEWSDLLNQQVADGSRNDLDLATDRPFTPEKWRVYRDTGSGLSRELIQYQDISSLGWFAENQAGDEDVLVVAPNQGNTIQVRSAKLLQYSVSYVSELTQAFAVSRDLESGDRVTLGLATGPEGSLTDDGYFIEQRGSDQNTDQAVLYNKRQGSKIGSEEEVSLGKALTHFRRTVTEHAWYNILGSEWRETFTRTGDVVENVLGKLQGAVPGDSSAGDGGRGPISGTGRVVWEIKRGGSASSIDAYVGSSSYKNLGTPTDQTLGKGFEVPGLSHSGGGSYEPVFVTRREPGRDSTLLKLLEAQMIDGPTDFKFLILACDPSNVLDGSDNELVDADFDHPNDVSPNFVPVQTTDGSTVDEFPDSSGTTTQSAADPGGYQLAFETTRSEGSGSNTVRRGARFTEQRGLLDGDVAVCLVETSSTFSNGKAFLRIGVN